MYIFHNYTSLLKCFCNFTHKKHKCNTFTFAFRKLTRNIWRTFLHKKLSSFKPSMCQNLCWRAFLIEYDMFFHVCMQIITHDFSTVVPWVHCNKRPSKIMKKMPQGLQVLWRFCYQHAGSIWHCRWAECSESPLSWDISDIVLENLAQQLRGPDIYRAHVTAPANGCLHTTAAQQPKDFFFLSWLYLLLWKSGFLMDESRFWL